MLARAGCVPCRHPFAFARALRRLGSSTMAAAAAAPPGGEDSAVPAARSTRVEPGDALDMEAYNERWHSIWGAGLQPGQRFDAGQCSPALLRLFSSAVPPAGRRVLVPGCGRGYDALAAAQAGAALAVGIDISGVAVEAAAALRDATLAPDAAARGEFITADFFTFTHPGGPFDIGYDYTFLCALPPTGVRQEWAAAWGRHLAPGGELITLIFPVDPDANPALGPPFPVTPELYSGLLLGAGFECIELEPLPSNLSHPARAGREWLGRWRWPGPGPRGGAGDAAAAASSKF